MNYTTLAKKNFFFLFIREQTLCSYGETQVHFCCLQEELTFPKTSNANMNAGLTSEQYICQIWYLISQKQPAFRFCWLYLQNSQYELPGTAATHFDEVISVPIFDANYGF